jgi:hypothetical protein
VSESIKYGLDTSIEGLVGVYDSAVEGNEQMTFFQFFGIIFFILIKKHKSGRGQQFPKQL